MDTRACIRVLSLAAVAHSLLGLPAQGETFRDLDVQFCQIFTESQIGRCSISGTACWEDSTCPSGQVCNILADYQKFVDELIEVKAFRQAPVCAPFDGVLVVTSRAQTVRFRVDIHAGWHVVDGTCDGMPTKICMENSDCPSGVCNLVPMECPPPPDCKEAVLHPCNPALPNDYYCAACEDWLNQTVAPGGDPIRAEASLPGCDGTGCPEVCDNTPGECEAGTYHCTDPVRRDVLVTQLSCNGGVTWRTHKPVAVASVLIKHPEGEPGLCCPAGSSCPDPA